MDATPQVPEDHLSGSDGSIDSGASGTDGGLQNPGTNDAGVPVDGGVPSLFPESPHLQPVVLPSCDVSARDVHIIDSPDDFGDINSSDLRVFCVVPGDYSAAGTVRLTSDGAAGNPRVLRFYDPAKPTDRTHPVRQQAGERAILQRMDLVGASHWIIDGLTVRNNPARTNTVHVRGQIHRQPIQSNAGRAR